MNAARALGAGAIDRRREAAPTRRRLPALKLTFTPLDRFGVNLRHIRILLLERQMGRLPTADLSAEEQRNRLVQSWLPQAWRKVNSLAGKWHLATSGIVEVDDLKQRTALTLLTTTAVRVRAPDQPAGWDVAADTMRCSYNLIRGERRHSSFDRRKWADGDEMVDEPSDDEPIDRFAAPGPSPEDRAAGREELAELVGKSSKLTPIQLMAIVGHMAGMNMRQIGAQWGVNGYAASCALQDAKRNLRQPAVDPWLARINEWQSTSTPVVKVTKHGTVRVARTADVLEFIKERRHSKNAIHVARCLRTLGWKGPLQLRLHGKDLWGFTREIA